MHFLVIDRGALENSWKISASSCFDKWLVGNDIFEKLETYVDPEKLAFSLLPNCVASLQSHLPARALVCVKAQPG